MQYSHRSLDSLLKLASAVKKGHRFEDEQATLEPVVAEETLQTIERDRAILMETDAQHSAQPPEEESGTQGEDEFFTPRTLSDRLVLYPDPSISDFDDVNLSPHSGTGSGI